MSWIKSILRLDRRRAFRRKAKGGAVLVPEPGSAAGIIHANVVDISIYGIGLHCERPLFRGDTYRVQLNGEAAALSNYVEIVTCRPRLGDGFEVGVRFV